MQPLPNRNKPAVRDRCIRHGQVALMEGARSVSNCTISPAQPEPKGFERQQPVSTKITRFWFDVDALSTLSEPYSTGIESWS